MEAQRLASRIPPVCLALALAACGAEPGSTSKTDHEPVAQVGEAIHSSHAGAAPWKHVLTCYGGCTTHYDPSACGHNTSCGPIADGTWWYATERAAFGCGAKLKLERDGKCVVVDVEDNGPADWVESNAASTCGVGYIIDASPLVADYFGGGCGWGECFTVDVSPVPSSTPTGPCNTTPENCTQDQATGCGNYGCHCVDGQCNGTFCPGSGCTADQVSGCGNYGCQCVDGQCSGGFCPNSGCTAKEALDCGNYGCQCVDHQCSGGFCPGTGCTAKESTDCGNYGCGCVDHQCSGVFCPGSGCTAKQDLDCKNQGQSCKDGKCIDGSSSSGGGTAGAAGAGGEPSTNPTGGSGGVASSTGWNSGGAITGSGGTKPKSTGGSAGVTRDKPATEPADEKGCGCRIDPRAPVRDGLAAVASIAALLVQRRRNGRRR